jgi:ABC-type branched-subunit amino acid transport system substrate-binding protein
MNSIRILLVRPDGDDPSPVDQSLGARVAALEGPDAAELQLEEVSFRTDDLGKMERQLLLWQGKVSGVVGATNVPQSTRLGELAEQMNFLCFVANNNPLVWQRRRAVFHIGLPSSQTAQAVARLLQKTQCRRIFLLHDETEFQSRVASSMEAALRDHGVIVAAQAMRRESELASVKEWRPDLIYLVFSSETKALPVAKNIRRQLADVPLLLGRSLLRESFLLSLGDIAGEVWFVDMFNRNGTQSGDQQHFAKTLSTHGVDVATANHGFGWDAMTFCARGLKAGNGEPARAIDYLESGVALQGVTDTCAFTPDNHNGRAGFGPTTLTRWYQGRLEAV